MKTHIILPVERRALEESGLEPSSNPFHLFLMICKEQIVYNCHGISSQTFRGAVNLLRHVKVVSEIIDFLPMFLEVVVRMLGVACYATYEEEFIDEILALLHSATGIDAHLKWCSENLKRLTLALPFDPTWTISSVEEASESISMALVKSRFLLACVDHLDLICWSKLGSNHQLTALLSRGLTVSQKSQMDFVHFSHHRMLSRWIRFLPDIELLPTSSGILSSWIALIEMSLCALEPYSLIEYGLTFTSQPPRSSAEALKLLRMDQADSRAFIWILYGFTNVAGGSSVDLFPMTKKGIESLINSEGLPEISSSDSLAITLYLARVHAYSTFSRRPSAPCIVQHFLSNRLSGITHEMMRPIIKIGKAIVEDHSDGQTNPLSRLDHIYQDVMSNRPTETDILMIPTPFSLAFITTLQQKKLGRRLDVDEILTHPLRGVVDLCNINCIYTNKPDQRSWAVKLPILLREQARQPTPTQTTLYLNTLLRTDEIDISRWRALSILITTVQFAYLVSRVMIKPSSIVARTSILNVVRQLGFNPDSPSRVSPSLLKGSPLIASTIVSQTIDERYYGPEDVIDYVIDLLAMYKQDSSKVCKQYEFLVASLPPSYQRCYVNLPKWTKWPLPAGPLLSNIYHETIQDIGSALAELLSINSSRLTKILLELYDDCPYPLIHLIPVIFVTALHRCVQTEKTETFICNIGLIYIRFFIGSWTTGDSPDEISTMINETLLLNFEVIRNFLNDIEDETHSKYSVSLPMDVDKYRATFHKLWPYDFTTSSHHPISLWPGQWFQSCIVNLFPVPDAEKNRLDTNSPPIPLRVMSIVTDSLLHLFEAGKENTKNFVQSLKIASTDPQLSPRFLRCDRSWGDIINSSERYARAKSPTSQLNSLHRSMTAVVDILQATVPPAFLILWLHRAGRIDESDMLFHARSEALHNMYRYYLSSAYEPHIWIEESREISWVHVYTRQNRHAMVERSVSNVSSLPASLPSCGFYSSSTPDHLIVDAEACAKCLLYKNLEISTWYSTVAPSSACDPMVLYCGVVLVFLIHYAGNYIIPSWSETVVDIHIRVSNMGTHSSIARILLRALVGSYCKMAVLTDASGHTSPAVLPVASILNQLGKLSPLSSTPLDPIERVILGQSLSGVDIRRLISESLSTGLVLSSETLIERFPPESLVIPLAPDMITLQNVLTRVNPSDSRTVKASYEALTHLHLILWLMSVDEDSYTRVMANRPADLKPEAGGAEVALPAATPLRGATPLMTGRMKEQLIFGRGAIAMALWNDSLMLVLGDMIFSHFTLVSTIYVSPIIDRSPGRLAYLDISHRSLLKVISLWNDRQLHDLYESLQEPLNRWVEQCFRFLPRVHPSQWFHCLDHLLPLLENQNPSNTIPDTVAPKVCRLSQNTVSRDLSLSILCDSPFEKVVFLKVKSLRELIARRLIIPIVALLLRVYPLQTVWHVIPLIRSMKTHMKFIGSLVVTIALHLSECSDSVVRLPLDSPSPQFVLCVVEYHIALANVVANVAADKSLGADLTRLKKSKKAAKAPPQLPELDALINKTEEMIGWSVEPSTSSSKKVITLWSPPLDLSMNYEERCITFSRESLWRGTPFPATNWRTSILLPVSSAFESPLEHRTHLEYLRTPGIKYINFLENEISILPTKQQPKIVRLVASDFKSYRWLLKKETEMRKDTRTQSMLRLMDHLVEGGGAKGARTYRVWPLDEMHGLIEWMVDTEAIRLKADRSISKFLSADGSINKLMSGHRASFDACQKNPKHTADQMYQQLRSIQKIYPPIYSNYMITLLGDDPSVYQSYRSNFIQSFTLGAVGGWILGLGDRHQENQLLDANGTLVHIDFDCILDKSRLLPIPEVVPFRLTPMICNFIGVFQLEHDVLPLAATIYDQFRYSTQIRSSATILLSHLSPNDSQLLIENVIARMNGQVNTIRQTQWISPNELVNFVGTTIRTKLGKSGDAPQCENQSNQSSKDLSSSLALELANYLSRDTDKGNIVLDLTNELKIAQKYDSRERGLTPFQVMKWLSLDHQSSSYIVKWLFDASLCDRNRSLMYTGWCPWF
eukprot:GHVH01010180.1.p1 GENE.GHVH01010180.1~~GHVH01010180.1.p1  ORF type:complete len:2055 (+),score=272.18 GHVH01010180.1:654-6818(+)